ncbi:MAG: DUF983 domain-containing protein [Hyphomicrobiaceae bacterium]|nr:DUF983 domain-containing protein [Hyphomicrobiaceae bacterium]
MAGRRNMPLARTLRSGMLARCPRCGSGKLFSGYLKIAPRCEACKLDFGFADSGDGPAVFIILIAGFLVVAAALIVEVMHRPPYWVHAALWLPLTAVLCLGLLRPFKATLIALQYRHKAEEGRIAKP